MSFLSWDEKSVNQPGEDTPLPEDPYKDAICKIPPGPPRASSTADSVLLGQQSGWLRVRRESHSEDRD